MTLFRPAEKRENETSYQKWRTSTCPRCKGSQHLIRDKAGLCYKCINCGRYQDPVSGQMTNAPSLEPRTKPESKDREAENISGFIAKMTEAWTRQ